ncbi:hypothetical protein [Robiginitalea sp.]|uniref:hypothetical protein n=1 Tax=Robiginitalea sp. TaxID=1902411 RepID=UPI003C529D1E
MEVKYIPETNTFEIKDGLRTVYVVLIVVMLINILNGVIYFIGNRVPPFEFLHYMWISIAMASLVLLWFFIFRKSTLSQVPYDQILRVVEKKVLGKKKLQLQLKNGKTRDLPQMKTVSDHLALRRVFEDAGFEVK